MAIVDNARRKQFQECTSFHELGELCNKYYYLFDNYADEIHAKMQTLPAQFDEIFIKYLIQSYRRENNNTYILLLYDYASMIVNSGLLKEYSFSHKYLPLIIYGASNHQNIHIKYLTQNSGLTEELCEKIFYNHDYSIDSEDRLCWRIIDLLTTQAAYEDFVDKYAKEDDQNCGNEYLMMRSKKIYNQYLNNKYMIIDLPQIEEYDIYHYLTYFISSIEIQKDNIRIDNNKSLNTNFDNAIRYLYNSIDMILLYIPIYKKPDIQVDINIVNKIKIDVLMAIIDEAFIYMKQFANLNITREDFLKYFRFSTDKDNNVICDRVIADSPTLLLDKDNSPIANEAYDENSSKLDKASRKIYTGYKAYKDKENKVNSQITKLITRIKDTFTGHKTARDRIIEENQFSAIKILKKIMTTAAIFSFNKIAGVLFVITRHYCSKAVDNRERRALISELELEIKMLDEKIDDARGDGNRQAKYSMMRTRAELQKALEKIKYGLNADKKALNTAKQVMTGKQSLDYDGPSNNDNY